MRTVTTVPMFLNNIFKVNKIQLRNFARALNQQQVTLPNQETLTGRILLYLNISKEKEPNLTSVSKITKCVLQSGDKLSKLNNSELHTFATTLIHQKLPRSDLLLVLKELDTECTLRVSELDNSDIFRFLNVYVNIIPHRVTGFKFYKHAIKILYDDLPSLGKKDVLQLIFYIGLRKKTLESQTMLRQCMRAMDTNFIESLTREELCIICSATFKTSTKIINRTLLEKIRSYINNNLVVLNDSALFVTLVKTLRHNRYQNDNLLNTISCTIFFNKTFTMYKFPMICHILALFADYFFYDEKLFKFFTKKCIEQLSESRFISKEMHLSEQLRGKDIKRFLWIMSMFSEMKLVNHCDIKNVIIPKLIERIKAGEFDGDLDSLVDISLYLWMLNYQAIELVPYIFGKNNWNLLTLNAPSKLRLNLLLEAIYIENRDLSNKLQTKPNLSNNISTYQLQKRPLIQRLLNNLEGMRKKVTMNKFQLSQDIPHLNIVGITGYKNKEDKAVHIEILDDYTRLKNIAEDVPVGLMALKLRLLGYSTGGVLVVSQAEVEDMTDAELNEYLLEELKLIC